MMISLPPPRCIISIIAWRGHRKYYEDFYYSHSFCKYRGLKNPRASPVQRYYIRSIKFDAKQLYDRSPAIAAFLKGPFREYSSMPYLGMTHHGHAHTAGAQRSTLVHSFTSIAGDL